MNVRSESQVTAAAAVHVAYETLSLVACGHAEPVL